jgi:signal peptidase I
MFGQSSRKEKKARVNASRCLDVADKVWNYRRDLMSEKESGELVRLVGNLRELLKAGADAGRLASATDVLEDALRRSGGSIHPATLLSENVEFFLVAAIVIIGFRSYFVQNFRIPTNSMWPSYNGMTPQVFARAEDEPGPVREAARILAAGAWPHRLDAPADGEVLIPIGGAERLGIVHAVTVEGRSWLVLPAKLRECTLLVDDRPVTVRLPIDFDFDWAVYDGFFSDGGTYSRAKLAEALVSRIRSGQVVDRVVDGEEVRCVRTGRHVKAGERLLAFDELSGDMVAVDRVSYNFVRPKVGNAIVFSTGKIPEVAEAHGDEYFIKRLVGVPGDTLDVRGTTLYRNGAPIEGSRVFDANARRSGNYPGYMATGLLEAGSSVHVEPGKFFAMGDNSPDSDDSRTWGFVPNTEVLGRPLGIYYPLARLGLAR